MDNIIKVNGMWVPADDQHINEWISGQPFTQNKCLTHFIRYCQQNDISFRTAIDVGAWCGTWAKIMSEHCHKIVAFEPDPTHYECLTKNVGMDVETHQLAVGSESRLISLNNGEDITAGRGDKMFPANMSSIAKPGKNCGDTTRGIKTMR